MKADDSIDVRAAFAKPIQGSQYLIGVDADEVLINVQTNAMAQGTEFTDDFQVAGSEHVVGISIQLKQNVRAHSAFDGNLTKPQGAPGRYIYVMPKIEPFRVVEIPTIKEFIKPAEAVPVRFYFHQNVAKSSVGEIGNKHAQPLETDPLMR